MPGPYVNAAMFCDRVLQEADGVISLIRVIDRLTVTAQAPGGEAPPELPEGQLQVTLVVTFKSDDAQGRYPVTIRPQLPSGTYLPENTIDVMFEGADRGVNLILNMQIPAIEGLYWFDVILNDQVLTRTPLRVMYQRMQSGA
jgi:hypothetical protein